MGEVLAMETGADEIAAWAATAPLTEGILTPFGKLDPAKLSPEGNVDAIIGLERLRRWVDAQQARHLAELTSRPGKYPGKVAKDFIREKVACATRWSVVATAQRFATANTLVHRLPATSKPSRWVRCPMCRRTCLPTRSTAWVRRSRRRSRRGCWCGRRSRTGASSVNP